jgi:hypothetical protein
MSETNTQYPPVTISKLKFNIKSKPVEVKPIGLVEHELDLMQLIETDDRQMLEIPRIKSMSVIDWGKTMAISNQYIQKNLLKKSLGENYKIFTTDDIDLPDDIKTENNSPGFDIIIQLPDGTYKRIQSKLRQVVGKTDTSQATHFETTRRNSAKNIDKNSSGHIAYSSDEFDIVMVSLVNVKDTLNNRNNCNLWTFVMVNIKELLDPKHNFMCCKTNIGSSILGQNIINFNNPEEIIKKLI